MERKVKGMETIDSLINALANQIKNLIENEGAQEHEVAEKTMALAALISAKAKLHSLRG